MSNPSMDGRRNATAEQASHGAFVFRRDCDERFASGGSLLLGLVSRVVNAWRLSGSHDHQRRVRSSRRVIRKLRGFVREDHEFGRARALAYLRAIDPFVFEETVLSALERRGLLVLRNRSYSGDGGLDGRAWWPGLGLRTVAVQAKRYQHAVRPEHVQALSVLVARCSFAGGLFVHTGRSGPMTYEALAGEPVRLVSGALLVELITGRATVAPAPAAPTAPAAPVAPARVGDASV